MTAATSRPSCQVAVDVGVLPGTLGRWCLDWHGPIGSGHTRYLDPDDIRVARAWRALSHATAKNHPVATTARQIVEHAIRRRPEGRYVVYGVTEGYATTVDTPADVVTTAAAEGLRCVGVIDLDPSGAVA